MLFTVVDILSTLLLRPSFLPFSWRVLWRGVWKGLLYGVIIGAAASGCFALIFGLSAGFQYGWQRGLEIGMVSGLLCGLMVVLMIGFEPDPPSVIETAGSKEKKGWRTRVVDMLIFSGCGVLGSGMVYFCLLGRSPNVLFYALTIGIGLGLVYGPANGTRMIPRLGITIEPAEMVAWSWMDMRGHVVRNLKKAFLVWIMVLALVIIALGGMSGFHYGGTYGIRYGVVYGLIIGLTGAVCVILTNLLMSGWALHILADHLRLHPNAGIHRSFRNALLAACLLGPLAGLISGLGSGFAFGVVGGLAGWLILATGLAILFSLVFTFHFFLFHGGIAVIEHYVLRWYLWRSGSVPWNYPRFLNYASERILLSKIGGGYLFIHRLLRDYLSGL